MRNALRDLEKPGFPAEHVGLAYAQWAPTAEDGKVPDNQRTGWLNSLAAARVPSDYRNFFDLWKGSFDKSGDRTFELLLASRLLVGHGNASATDVGLTVHHTWGVPMVPGPTLKGLLAHYVDAVHGPGNPDRNPWEQEAQELARVDFQGVVWHGRRIHRGPGRIYRLLFGAPDAEEDPAMLEHGLEAGASAGIVVFHDALYVPGSAPDDTPFAVDVLTVHQKRYYDTSGKFWPNDYDDPNPVAFLTVRPGTRMLFALSGPSGWTELAERLLRDALEKWGVGGKTSSGYGRFIQLDQSPLGLSLPAKAAGIASSARHQRGDRVSVTRIEDPKGKMKFRADDGLLCHFAGEEPPRVEVGQSLEVWIANVSLQSYTITLREPKSLQESKKRK